MWKKYRYASVKYVTHKVVPSLALYFHVFIFLLTPLCFSLSILTSFYILHAVFHTLVKKFTYKLILSYLILLSESEKKSSLPSFWMFCMNSSKKNQTSYNKVNNAISIIQWLNIYYYNYIVNSFLNLQTLFWRVVIYFYFVRLTPVFPVLLWLPWTDLKEMLQPLESLRFLLPSLLSQRWHHP